MRSSEQDGPERTGTELTRYVHSARSYLPLTREEEHQIAVRARRGDAAASHRLIRHNLALVASIARKQVRGTVQLDDLIQEGNLGLLRAVELFDPQAGTRFSTYAVWWIRAFIGRYLRQARSSVRPRSGMLAACDVSLDAVVGRGDLTRLELLEDESPTAESRYLAEEGASALRGALGRVRARLGEVGWSIVHERLQQDEPRTLTDLGRRWGLSRERVRQVELRTRRFLRSHLERVAREADAPPLRAAPRTALLTR